MPSRNGHVKGGVVLSSVPQARELRLRIDPATAKALGDLAKIYGWKSTVELAQRLLSESARRAVNEVAATSLSQALMNLWAGRIE
jgi:hypothetical protein